MGGGVVKPLSVDVRVTLTSGDTLTSQMSRTATDCPGMSLYVSGCMTILQAIHRCPPLPRTHQEIPTSPFTYKHTPQRYSDIRGYSDTGVSG